MSTYLIADSVEENRKKLETILKKTDGNALILTTFSNHHSNNDYSKRQPDLIFWNPGTSPIDWLELNRAYNPNQNIPVILIGDHQTLEEFLQTESNSLADAILPLSTGEEIFALQISFLLARTKTPNSLNLLDHPNDSEKPKKTTDENSVEPHHLQDHEVLQDALLQTIIDNAPFEIWARDQNEMGIIENIHAAKHYGSIIGKTPDSAPFDSDIVKAWKNNNRQVLNGKTINEEYKFDYFGQTRDYHQIIAPIQTAQGISGIIGFSFDITDRKRAEKALMESEEKFRSVTEKSIDGILIVDESGILVEMNQAIEGISGMNRARFKGQPVWNFLSELLILKTPKKRENAEVKAFVNHIINSHPSNFFGYPVEQKIQNQEGIIRIVETVTYQVLAGEKRFFVTLVRDITERKLFEEALKNSESKYYGLFNANRDGISIFVINPNQKYSRFIEVNTAAYQMFGYTRDEYLKLGLSDLRIENGKHDLFRQLEELKEGDQINLETRIRHKNGTLLYIDLSIRLIHYNNQVAFMIIAHDITERKKAEKAVADEQILLKTLINNIPDLIYVKDLEARKIISNKADLEMMGFTDEKDVIGKTDFDFYNPVFAKKTFDEDMSVIHSGIPIINRIELISGANGEEKYISTSKVPLKNDSGEIIGLVGVGHDITRIRQTEQKLVQLSKGIEQSPASIVITDMNGNIEYANPKLTEISGFTFEEVKGQNPRIFQSGLTSKKEYRKLWDTILSGNEYRNEIQNRKKNGELFWESVLISPIRDEAGQIANFIAIKEDITDRKKADLEIQKLSFAIEQNPASVAITDTHGVIEYVNKKFIATTGYLKEELIGEVVRILCQGKTSDDKYIEIWNSLFAGVEWKGEFKNQTKKGQEYWESVLISPIKNQDGKVRNFIIQSEDISDRKKMEKDLIAAKEKAEESDRLKSAFLANMSHEIRTPLNSILGFSDLLTEADLDADSKKEFSGLITSSGNNLLAIINDVLDISKIESGQIVLNERELIAQNLISDIQKEYSYKSKAKGVDLIVSNNTPLKPIVFWGDEVRIKQVLINFVGNAIKFTEHGYIEIGVILTDQTIRFHVKDSGIGIPKEYHEKIFDRFRQVEAPATRKYGGNGLGLAITRNLADLMNGKIWLESEINKGSTFFFALPESVLISEKTEKQVTRK